MVRRGVSLGVAGSTPRKEQEFSKELPSSFVPRASPDRSGPAPTVALSTPQRDEISQRRQARYEQLRSADVAAAAAVDNAQVAAAAAEETSVGVQARMRGYEAAGQEANKAAEAAEYETMARLSGSAGSRPTTSRHVPNPTPDKFSDYIVPSPPNARKKSSGGRSTEMWENGDAVNDDGGGGAAGLMVVGRAIKRGGAEQLPPAPAPQPEADQPLPPPPPPARGGGLSATAPPWRGGAQWDSPPTKSAAHKLSGDAPAWEPGAAEGGAEPTPRELAELGRWLLGMALST